LTSSLAGFSIVLSPNTNISSGFSLSFTTTSVLGNYSVIGFLSFSFGFENDTTLILGTSSTCFSRDTA